MSQRKRSRGVARALIAVMAAHVIPGGVSAHDIPGNTVVPAFVRVQPGELHFVVRVPLDLLEAVQFPARGDEIDLKAAGPATESATRTVAEAITLWENGVQLVPSKMHARLSLPSDRSFVEYRRAVAHVAEPLPEDVGIYYGQGSLDAHIVYPIAGPRSVFSIETKFALDLGDLVKLTLQYTPVDGDSRASIITSDLGRVALNPTYLGAAGTFVDLGIEHILSGFDHLLFLLCLVIPLRRPRDLIVVVTAFTVGHSVTLISAAYGLVPSGAWFPPFVEAAIAASIVYVAIENIVRSDLRHRWIITAMFGLMHGFGFSYALREDLQLAGSHHLISLLSFNLGIEIGQLAVLAVMIVALGLTLRGALAGPVGIIVLSVLVGHTAWHWMLERMDVLLTTQWPTIDAAAITVPTGWIVGIFLTIGIIWMLSDKWRVQDALPRILMKARHPK